jgi:chromosomal replication initiation ATPase DnaA
MKPRSKETTEGMRGHPMTSSHVDIDAAVGVVHAAAAIESVTLPDDVALHLAWRFAPNRRTLEGAVIRVIAYASLCGVEPSVEIVDQIAQHMTG